MTLTLTPNLTPNQALLDATLFEPGAHLPARSADLEPQDVPTSAPELLGTPHHLLLNELTRSPATLVECVLKLAQQASDLDTGTFKASTTTVRYLVITPMPSRHRPPRRPCRVAIPLYPLYLLYSAYLPHPLHLLGISTGDPLRGP